MQSIILVGGKGTRLRTLYSDRPKALVPILDRAFLEWQIEWLQKGGITDIHLAAGYKAHMLIEWAAEHTTEEVRITASAEPEPLGTGGGLKYIEDRIQSDPFVTLNGDSLLPNLDFQAMMTAYAASDAPVMIAVTHLDSAGRYGTVEFDERDHKLTAFLEKQNRHEGWVNAGIYMMRKDILQNIKAGEALSIERDIFPALAEKGQVRVFKADGPLLDMGTPEGIQNMEAYLSA